MAVVYSPVACGSYLPFACGCPSFHTFSPFGRPGECTSIVERRRGHHGGYLFGGGHVGVGWYACVPSGVGPLGLYLAVLAAVRTTCVHWHTSWLLRARGLIALACVLWCGVPFVFFRVALCVWGPSSPCCFHTPSLSHGVRIPYVRGTCGRQWLCSLGCDGAVVVVFFPTCVVRPSALPALGSVG